MENIRHYSYRKCAFCGVRKLPKSNTLLSSFPLDPDQCRLWVKATGDEDLIHLPIEKLHELKYICGSHFVPEFFNTKGNCLLKTAVPTVKLTRPPLSDDTLNEFPLHVKSFYEMKKKDSVVLAESTNINTRMAVEELFNYLM
ncbi:uncharacterized protein LOC125074670 [Vanessa atalanta]|uniref:uncharacterized protein LOC125074670 n=1 Tax=Vanessa atalanta TaxID=42275 RepID=UPI001FCD4A57|nr:uncharacterized protein LOC125074670 [Vanessa atalanta]